MKNPFRLSSLFFFILFHSIWSQYIIEDRSIHYRPGDWISYPVMRYMTSITLDFNYAYFGSKGGIGRFDFNRRKWDRPFTVSDGLTDDHIEALFYDRNTGYLWCATETGLSYFLSGADQWKNISYADIFINHDFLAPVIVFGEGKESLWVRDAGRIPYKADRTLGNFSKSNETALEKDDVQWYEHRIQDEDLFNHYFIEQGYLIGPEPVIEDREARKYRVTSTLKDHFNRIFMTTHGLGAGVANINMQQIELYPFGLFTDGLEAIAWDDEGMWIGSQPLWGEENAITWWNMDHEDWIYYEAQFTSNIQSDRVTSIVTDSRYVWFGTDYGLVRFDKKKSMWRTFNIRDNLWKDQITSLALGNNILWIGTESGLNWMQLSDTIIHRIKKPYLRHRMIYHLEVDGADVWVGTDRGLFLYRGEKQSWEVISGSPFLVSLDVTAISVFNEEVWCGRMDGVEVFNKTTNSWRGYSDSQYPTQGPYNIILADSSAVWFGTENGVLKYIKDEDRWRRFTTEDGLLDNSVRWMLLDWDYIWFATQRGLTRFYWNAPYRID